MYFSLTWQPLSTELNTLVYMKLKFFQKRKFWVRSILFLIVLPALFLSVLVALVYKNQDTIVEQLVETLNDDFKGNFKLNGSHISPFKNFPYVSIDLEKLYLYENEEEKHILDVEDVYIGFNIWDIILGNMEIKSIVLSNGSINIVQLPDGSFNITNALQTNKKIEDPSEEFHINLNSIQLTNIDINKLNTSNGMYFDLFVNSAKSRFKTFTDSTHAFLDAKFIITYIDNGDTTFIHDKHFDVHTEIDYISKDELLKIVPSEIALEGAIFNMKGEIDFTDNVNLNINFKGEKPNFDLLIAFAPDELTPTLELYKNRGNVYFNGTVIGPCINGNTPYIDAAFGCSEALIQNTVNNKKLDNLRFTGHFSNGEKRDLSSMEFSLSDFSVNPEAGIFSGDLSVQNFISPEINLKLISDFKLDFLADFFNLQYLQDLSGGVELTMNFHDIIDLNNPEKSIERLNESYFTELKVSDLSFKAPDYHLPLKDLDLYAVMDGHKATIDYANLKLGNSDLKIKGSIDDLPAILHHTNKDVVTKLEITSNFLDLFQLTTSATDSTTSIDETLSNVSLALSFKNSAKDFTESPYLPIGEFFIDDFHAQLKNYPHNFHDFHADLIIESENLQLKDFSGMIDKSDFHFNGNLTHYDKWFLDNPNGVAKVEFNLNSTLLQLEDLFSYKGENYVPEDYRHEQFEDLKIHGFADLHFNKNLYASDVTFDLVETNMKLHKSRFRDFGGRIHLENNNLSIENLRGKLGESSFNMNADLFFENDSTSKSRTNRINFQASRLNFDQLTNYQKPVNNYATKPEDHEKGFNIYEVPFPNLKVDLNIEQLNYHLYNVRNFNGSIRTTSNHFIYIDTLSLEAAGGQIKMSGYFNGSNPKLIYFSPKMNLDNVDLDELLLKFENFGQDYLVSENLHGKLSGDLWGKIHIHKDMVPIIDDSEIHLDFNVVSGKLENFGPMKYLADYFADKNVAKVLFDTLRNHIDLKGGSMNIPNMKINTSLGFVEISGTQNSDFSFEYFLKVPWKMITKAGVSKLFAKKDQANSEDDEIIYATEGKKIRYVNIQLKGDLEDYTIKLKKKK